MVLVASHTPYKIFRKQFLHPILVGAGEYTAHNTTDDTDDWIRDNTLDNISEKNPYFFAPAGGRIEDISYKVLNSGFQGFRAYFSGFKEGEYQGLQVFYNGIFMMHPGEIHEITYTVTTAQGVSDIPVFSITPVSSLRY